MFSDDRAVDARRCRRALLLHYSKFVCAMSLVGLGRVKTLWHQGSELGELTWERFCRFFGLGYTLIAAISG